MAVMAGQSNMAGRNANDSLDTFGTNIFQYGGNSTIGATYQLLLQLAALPDHFNDASLGVTTAQRRVGPCVNLLKKLEAQYPNAKIVAVPVAIGSTAMVGGASPAWASSATPAAGGSAYEFMVNQANAARAAILVAYPGASITPIVFYVQGEQDASLAVSKASYYTGLSNFIANTRTRITGASGCLIVIGSMVPDNWDPANASYSAAYAAINNAHVDASIDLTSVKYLAGPRDPSALNDNLHYQPHAAARQFGDWLGDTLTDASGPTMTSASTYSNGSGSVLALALTASDTYAHATFHLNGGADVAQFEISDRYLTPTLRWTGNGTGPAAGSYTVGVRARDGAGNYGATQTITLTVSAEVSPATFFTGGERGMVWDLSSLANLKQNIDGTGAVTTVGDPVGYVADLSGNGNHWKAAANDTTRPTYQTDADGKAYLSFDGTNDVLHATTPFLTTTDGKYSAGVGVFAAAPGAQKGILGAYSTGGTSPRMEAIRAETTGGDISLDQTNDGASGGGPFPTLAGMLDNTTKRVISSHYNGSGGTIRLRNAAARPSGGGTGSYQSVTQGTFPQNFTSLSRSTLGARGFGTVSGFFAGRIYSGFVINRYITDAEVKNGEDWIASRVLTAALP